MSHEFKPLACTFTSVCVLEHHLHYGQAFPDTLRGALHSSSSACAPIGSHVLWGHTCGQAPKTGCVCTYTQSIAGSTLYFLLSRFDCQLQEPMASAAFSKACKSREGRQKSCTWAKCRIDVGKCLEGRREKTASALRWNTFDFRKTLIIDLSLNSLTLVALVGAFFFVLTLLFFFLDGLYIIVHCYTQSPAPLSLLICSVAVIESSRSQCLSQWEGRVAGEPRHSCTSLDREFRWGSGNYWWGSAWR